MVEAEGCLTKMLANGALKSYIGRYEPEILTHLELLVNIVSMEEAVQQQAEPTPKKTSAKLQNCRSFENYFEPS
jgi:hypothetical protein